MRILLQALVRVAGGLALLIAYSVLTKFLLDHQGTYLSAVLTIPAVILPIGGGALLFSGVFAWMDRHELEPIRQRGTEIRNRLGSQPQPDVFNTVQLGLNQLEEYYIINKRQARSSFRFSIFAVLAGLATVLGGIWLFYLKKLDAPLTAISTATGILLQFVGGAGFYLYNKSIEQLGHFYDRLIRMQETMLAVALCEQISDEDRKNAVKERMVFELLAGSQAVGGSGPLEPPKGRAQAGQAAR